MLFASYLEVVDSNLTRDESEIVMNVWRMYIL